MRVLSYFLVCILKFLLTRALFPRKTQGGVSFFCVACYEMLGYYADYVFSAKQKPKKFKRTDDFYFFGSCCKLIICVLNQVSKHVIKFSIMKVLV